VNRYQLVGLFLLTSLVLASVNCGSKTASLISPAQNNIATPLSTATNTSTATPTFTATTTITETPTASATFTPTVTATETFTTTVTSTPMNTATPSNDLNLVNGGGFIITGDNGGTASLTTKNSVSIDSNSISINGGGDGGFIDTVVPGGSGGTASVTLSGLTIQLTPLDTVLPTITPNSVLSSGY